MVFTYLGHPRWTLGLALLFMLAFAAGLTGVSKDPAVDAFVPGDHPAALARDAAREIFGLEDPAVIGLAARNRRGQAQRRGQPGHRERHPG